MSEFLYSCCVPNDHCTFDPFRYQRFHKFDLKIIFYFISNISTGHYWCPVPVSVPVNCRCSSFFIHKHFFRKKYLLIKKLYQNWDFVFGKLDQQQRKYLISNNKLNSILYCMYNFSAKTKLSESGKFRVFIFLQSFVYPCYESWTLFDLNK